MKMKPASVLLLSSIAISSPSIADNFSAQNGAPSITHSHELQQYVNTIANYKPQTEALNTRLQKTIDYYRRVHILKTVSKKNYTVDCIPFAEQPALIDRPELAQSLLPKMSSITRDNLAALKAMGRNFDFNAATECPLGSIAMIRPSKTILTSAIANQKTFPHKNFPHSTLDHAGYTWEQGYTPEGEQIEFITQGSQAYFKGPQNQHITDNQEDHSLNQFWYTTDDHGTFSTEFGIIASAYFTTTPATTIFVFASIDNYGNASCYDLLCPNFIQAPGSPALGVPISNLNADYIFQFKHITSPGFEPGTYLSLLSHSAADKNQHGSTLMGYYANSLYKPQDIPQSFSAGAEVYAIAPGNGTLMYGNYSNPYAEYPGAKVINLTTENDNVFTFSSSVLPPPYGLTWNLGQ